MNEIWKQPARLWRRREPLGAPEGEVTARAVASGPLEEMVRRALAAFAEGGDAERHNLFIDCGVGELLGWSEIRKLSRSPSFPVEI